MDKQKRSRKWKLALWGAYLSTAAVLAGLYIALTGGEATGLAQTLILQGFGFFLAVLGAYSVANVGQKHIERQSNANTTGSN